MSITQGQDGRWLVDCEPVKGRRYRRKFKTKAEALRFEAFVRQGHVDKKDWNPSPKDRRRLSELAASWYALYGHSLRDGKRRHDALLAISSAMSDPVAIAMTGQHFSVYRSDRLKEGITPKTLNNHLSYVKAVFNELKALDEIGYGNPLAGVRPLRVPERELSWLTSEQISRLLDEIRMSTENPHVEIITLVCLATGCRWSEAESLTLDKLRNCSVVFPGVTTKNLKTRTVPIDPALFVRLEAHLKQYSEMPFSLSAFRRALKRSGIELPSGQASHALRHTFASHFVMQGGNMLVLQRVLGHSSINITMRYAHLAPEHFQEAVMLSPVNSVRHIFDTAPPQNAESP